MSEVYRGHEIVLVDGTPRSAIIFERESGVPLPTKVTSMPDEDDQSCLLRARRLVDIYLQALQPNRSPPAQSLTL